MYGRYHHSNFYTSYRQEPVYTFSVLTELILTRYFTSLMSKRWNKIWHPSHLRESVTSEMKIPGIMSHDLSITSQKHHSHGSLADHEILSWIPIQSCLCILHDFNHNQHPKCDKNWIHLASKCSSSQNMLWRGWHMDFLVSVVFSKEICDLQVSSATMIVQIPVGNCWSNPSQKKFAWFHYFIFKTPIFSCIQVHVTYFFGKHSIPGFRKSSQSGHWVQKWKELQHNVHLSLISGHIDFTMQDWQSPKIDWDCFLVNWWGENSPSHCQM